MTRARFICVTFASFALAGSAACAQGDMRKTSSSSDTASLREFSQQFLDWYVTLPSPSNQMKWWPVLSAKPPVLDSGLAAALRADSSAWQGDTPSRETLDFDPFVGGQDMCRRYVASDIIADAGGYRVSVRAICGTAAAPQPGGTAAFLDVRRAGGRWLILNVHYVGGNLAAILCKRALGDLNPERRPKTCP
jgi:hypothetical protein